jgi:protein TonB
MAKELAAADTNVKNVTAGMLQNQDPTPQRLKVGLIISAAFHLLFFIASLTGLFDRNDWLREEWEFEADLVADLSVSQSQESALPRVKIAEEAAVPKQILPQLPERYKVEEKTIEPADAMKEEVTPKAEPKLEPEPLKEQALPVPSTPQEDVAKIEAAELLKRKALEQLRTDKKFADDYQAQKSEAIARLKNEDIKDPGALNDSMVTGIAVDKYRGAVHQHIQKYYELPDAQAYNFNPDMRNAAAIEIDQSGNIVAVAIHESSGDAVYDQLVLDIIQKSSPLPKPPLGFEGKFLLRFSPGGMK